MVNYLNIVEKHVFDMLKFVFKLYNNIFVPIWVDFHWTGRKRGVVEVDLDFQMRYQ
jgi:hypothetical protein